MKWIIFLILLLLSCIASNTNQSSRLITVYYDGCYYIITEQGGITHKANCTNSIHNN